MVAAVSQAATPNSNINSSNSTPTRQRPPSLNSGSRISSSNSTPKKVVRGKQFSSRYLSPSSSTTRSSCSSTSSSITRRYQSPLISRSTNNGSLHTPQTKRSQPVDRRRSVTPRPSASNPGLKQGNVTEVTAGNKMLITSTRSLSVSFQGEAFSLPVSKEKSVTIQLNVGRKGTPERRRVTPVRDHRENSRNLDQYRWLGTGRSREVNLVDKERSELLCRSLGCGGGDLGVIGSGLLAVKSLQKSILVDDNRRLSFDLRAAKQSPDANLGNEPSLAGGELTVSGSDSVSSGSTSGLQDFAGAEVCKGKNVGCGIAMSARFWQETNSRLRRLQDPGSPLSSSPGTRMGVQSKTIQSKRFRCEGPLASLRTMASPMRGTTRLASPSKLASSVSSPMQGISSPSGVRTMSDNSTSSPSILSFSVDLLRRAKLGENRILDAHLLRLLYNRFMQWRFVNASAEATVTVQRLNAEKNLWNAWITVSELRHSVTLKRIKLLLLKKKLKLMTIIKGQTAYLEEWSVLDRDHSNSLDGAIEALKASTLRLPVTGKAIADVQNVKNAVCSAVDVMQAMASAIRSLSSKVEDINSLVAELLNVAANERFFLQQCKEFLSTISALQVKDCSLRTDSIQVNRLPLQAA